ncbi:MAG: transglycosylase SLT domain-containing protein [Nanoarchaeota archaeon]|nr:lytic transglycosylase domain-containing protein [Nanoarchaeota archaeon]MBU1031276.1 lytic transglycosylase domain-containing protein [Nanoarchaeota archaeon]MBU1849507.1 lytic transglycosylase domain-containing protein [Nanoarchaeota archaeon]
MKRLKNFVKLGLIYFSTITALASELDGSSVNQKPMTMNSKTTINKTVTLNNYMINKEDDNWQILLQKEGFEIEEDRMSLGVKKFAGLLGIELGRFAAGRNSLDLILSDMNTFKIIGEKNGVDPFLLAAIRKVESGGLDKCISHTGALGPDAHTSSVYGERTRSDNSTQNSINPFNRVESAKRTAEHIDYLMNIYQDITITLIAYNQGETVVNRALRYHENNNGEEKDSTRMISGLPKWIEEVINIKNTRGRYVISYQGRTYYKKIFEEREELKNNLRFKNFDFIETYAVASSTNYVQTEKIDENIFKSPEKIAQIESFMKTFKPAEDQEILLVALNNKKEQKKYF